jgi:uncharacterized alpha-E superfamily protein
MPSDNSPDSWQEIELQIQETSELLESVNQKFDEAKATDRDRQNLNLQQQAIEHKLKTKLNLRQRQELKSQLQTIQTSLEDIDTAIAAQLVTWSSFKEPFWQIVRYSGLGFLLGILVKGCVG